MCVPLLSVQKGDIEFWTKPIIPTGSFAFALLNLGTATPTIVKLQLSDLGFTSATGYNITEVFDGTYVGMFKPSSELTVSVNPSGVYFAQAVAVSASDNSNDDDYEDGFIDRLLSDRL